MSNRGCDKSVNGEVQIPFSTEFKEDVM